MHGVVLRPPARVVIGPPAPPAAPIKNIEQLMAEADPVRTLSETGSIRMLKRVAPDRAPETRPIHPPVKPETVKLSPAPATAPLPHAELAAPTTSAVKSSFQTVSVPRPVELKKPEPAPGIKPAPQSPISIGPAKQESPAAPVSQKSPTESGNIPKEATALMPLVSIFRRKAKMADVARIVLPPKKEETTATPPPPESAPTVIPPAFPVVAMAANETNPVAVNPEPGKEPASPAIENPVKEKSVTDDAAPTIKMENSPPVEVEAAKPIDTASAPAEPLSTPAPPAEEVPSAPVSDVTEPAKVDPAPFKPEPTAILEPKIDPETSQPAPDAPPAKELSVTPEKREFHLANGERVAGVVLSETPEAVYIDHATLGVLTIPREQIAKRLVEIILMNGDRIVGDIMAETADTLYVRHASLGMLTVPRAQRSTRVVEAILKDGDRILGEVLTETDAFTIIRSATLGTITVPHGKMAMLNRKIEQIELKSLPPPVPELKDKPAL